MADIIDLQAWREALAAAAEATDALHDVLSHAAARCAAGEFSKEDRAALPVDLIRTFGCGDGGGWSFARYERTAAPKPDDVLHEVLSLAADEAGARILSAEGRAILINAVFLALGGVWEVERAA